MNGEMKGDKIMMMVQECKEREWTEDEGRINVRTVESLFVKWTIQPSLSTFEPLLLVCFTL